MAHDFACAHCDKVFLWGEDADSAIVTQPGCGENAHWKLKAHMLAKHPGEMFVCGRQHEGFGSSEPESYWNGDGTCSYCGSISPKVFFDAVEAGAEVGPTDKSYKAYIDLPDKEVSGFTIYSSANWAAPGLVQLTAELCDEYKLDSYQRLKIGSWVKIEPRHGKQHAKFYFQHLSEDEKHRFIDLLNNKTMKIGMPGHFYARPFFIARPVAA